MEQENKKLLKELKELIVKIKPGEDIYEIMDKLGELIEQEYWVYYPFMEQKGYEDNDIITKGIKTPLDKEMFLTLGTDENVLADYDVDLCYIDLYEILNEAFFDKNIGGVVFESDGKLFPINKYNMLVLMHLADLKFREKMEERSQNDI